AEHPDYPKGTEFRLRSRGATTHGDHRQNTRGSPRFGKWGKQSCTDTGALTKERMETVDEEFVNATLDFIDRANQDKKPFFAWFNSTRTHIWTRLKPEAQAKDRLVTYRDGMVEDCGWTRPGQRHNRWHAIATCSRRGTAWCHRPARSCCRQCRGRRAFSGAGRPDRHVSAPLSVV